MYEEQFEKYADIAPEKFEKIDSSARITDKKFSTKPVGYFRDAMSRFRRNRSSVVAAIIILLLFLYAMIIPWVSNYDVSFRDGYYKLVLPKWDLFAWAGMDGCGNQRETQAGYDYYNSIGYELGDSAVKKVKGTETDESGIRYYNLYVDSYDKVGFVYADLTKAQYQALQDYQNETGIQVIYPLPANYKTNYVAVTSGANLWYELADDSPGTQGLSAHHDEEGNPIYVPAYHTSKNEHRAKYDSLRIPTRQRTSPATVSACCTRNTTSTRTASTHRTSWARTSTVRTCWCRSLPARGCRSCWRSRSPSSTSSSASSSARSRATTAAR